MGGDSAGDKITADSENRLGGDSAGDKITADSENRLGGDSAGDEITADSYNCLSGDPAGDSGQCKLFGVTRPCQTLPSCQTICPAGYDPLMSKMCGINQSNTFDGFTDPQSGRDRFSSHFCAKCPPARRLFPFKNTLFFFV